MSMSRIYDAVLIFRTFKRILFYLLESVSVTFTQHARYFQWKIELNCRCLHQIQILWILFGFYDLSIILSKWMREWSAIGIYVWCNSGFTNIKHIIEICGLIILCCMIDALFVFDCILISPSSICYLCSS